MGDLIIRNFSVQKAGADGADLGTCRVQEVVPKRALDVEEIASNEVFRGLSEMDQDNAVVLAKQDGERWLFVEESFEKVDELLAALMILSGAGLKETSGREIQGKKEIRKSKKKKTELSVGALAGKGGGSDVSPVTPRVVAMAKKAPE